MSSSETVCPSTYRRPNPLRRRAAASRPPSPRAPEGPAGPSRRPGRPRHLDHGKRTCSSRPSTPSRFGRVAVATTGMSNPMRSRGPRTRPELSRDDLGRFAHHLAPAIPAHGAAYARKQQSEVIVDFRRGADRGSGVADAVLLPNRNRRADAFDGVDVGLLHPLEELAGVGRQRLDIAALALCIDRVEGERRLSRPA